MQNYHSLISLWWYWFNKYFWRNLLAWFSLFLVFLVSLPVTAFASYFDPNDPNFNANQTILKGYQLNTENSPNTTLNDQNSDQISNEVRQRLTNDLQPSNQSSRLNIEALDSKKCTEWLQIADPDCLGRFVLNFVGYIIIIIFALIGALIDVGVYYAFLIIEKMLSGNPTAQGSDAWFIALQIYPVLLNISLLLILFSFYYVGFQYLFGLKSGRVGWQEFLAKVVLAVVLVNFSVYLVSIFVSFLHDVGTLFVNIYARGGGSIGGSFQVAMKQAAGFNLDATNFVENIWTITPNLFSPVGDYWTIVITRVIYVIVSIFILTSLFRLVKIVITRYVLLFLLLVIAPLGVVLFFSPIKALKEKGDEWLKTLWTQTILYPFFVIAMAIGSVFVVSLAQAAVPVGEMQYLEQTKISSQFPRVLALLVAFGVIQVIVNFFEKQFEGIASSTWTAIKMGTVGALATAGGSLWTAGSTVKNAIQGARRMGSKGAEWGGKKFGKFGAALGGLAGGAAGGLIGGGIGVKRGINRTAQIAAGVASAVDLLGGEKVADKLANAPGILGKTFRAAQAQNKAFFANFAGLLAKKASFATTEALRKAGLGDMALELRRDIDIAIDMILPPNDYTGDSRKDLPGIGEGWGRAGNAAKLAAYSSFGYNPKLSNSQVLQRLEDIVTGNTPRELQNNYSSYVESVKEIAEEIIKRPEIISKLTPQQIEFFRVNYERLLRDVPGWEEFVMNGGGVLLGDEDARKTVARNDAAKGIQVVQEGRVDRRNFKDSVYLNEYVASLRQNGKSEDLKELGNILGKDFSAFAKLDLANINQQLQPYAKYLRDFGLSSDVEKAIFRELAKMPNIGTLDTGDLQREVRDKSETYLREQFFKVNQIQQTLQQTLNTNQNTPVETLLNLLTQDNKAFQDFVNHLIRSQNRQISNINELQRVIADYESFVNELTTAFIDPDRISEVAGKFTETNAIYKSKRSDFQLSTMRGLAAALAQAAAPATGSGTGGGTGGTGGGGSQPPGPNPPNPNTPNPNPTPGPTPNQPNMPNHPGSSGSSTGGGGGPTSPQRPQGFTPRTRPRGFAPRSRPNPNQNQPGSSGSGTGGGSPQPPNPNPNPNP